VNHVERQYKLMSTKTAVESNIQNNPNNEVLSISLSYGELKAQFTGQPEAVLQSLNSFLTKQIPELSLARRLSVSFSAKELVDLFQNYVKITPEGPRVWSNAERKYSDKELVALQLVAQKISSEASGSNSSSMTLASLQEATALNPKSLSSRLSELAKSGQVLRETSQEATTFRITTQGIHWLASVLAKKP
jgi:predicted transcriptional regulator